MLEYLAGGDSIEELLREFPDLEKEDLLAASRTSYVARPARQVSGQITTRTHAASGVSDDVKIRKRHRIVALFWIPFWSLALSSVVGLLWAGGWLKF